MNKEIKEILYMLKSVVDDPKSTFQANATTCYLLLDYITNLQEENVQTCKNMGGKPKITYCSGSSNMICKVECLVDKVNGE